MFSKSAFTGARYGYAWYPFDTSEIKFQSIYYPSDFPTMPPGKVTSIYLRLGNVDLFPAPDTTINSNVSISIGHTDDSGFIMGSIDSFKPGLSQVFFSPSYSFVCDSNGKWLQFPLSAPWHWDGLHNIVVEFRRGQTVKHPNFRRYHGIMLSGKTWPQRRILAGHPDSATALSAYDSASTRLLDIGFDLPSTGTHQPVTTYSMHVFPNYSQNGKFNISLHFPKALQSANLSVSDLAGATYYTHSISTNETTWQKQLDLSAAPKGIYTIKLVTGYGMMIRKIILF